MYTFYCAVPQKERHLQLRAIASLPYYANICSRFIPMVRDLEAWKRVYGTDDGHNIPAGTLDVYLSRGWCRLEIVAALCPKRFEGSGSWRPGPINLRYRYHHDPAHAGVGRRITAADLLDPREGTFYKDADKQAIEPVLRRIALEYQEYEESGATSWNSLIDVASRPIWLKALAIETRLKGLSTSVSIGKGAKGSMFDTSGGPSSPGRLRRAFTASLSSSSPSPTARLSPRWVGVLPNGTTMSRARNPTAHEEVSQEQVLEQRPEAHEEAPAPFEKTQVELFQSSASAPTAAPETA